jgi:hypothetical protein
LTSSSGLQQRPGVQPLVRDILRAGRRHALEGVEQIQVPAAILELRQRPGGGHHAAAAPDTALNDVAGNLASDEIGDRLAQGKDTLRGGAREGADAAHRVDDRLVEIRRKGRRGRTIWHNIDAKPVQDALHRTHQNPLLEAIDRRNARST